jgi:hypothetical protein
MLDDDRCLDIFESEIVEGGFDIQWLANFTNKFRKFRNFKSLKLPTNMPTFDILVGDLQKKKFQVGNHIDLSELLDVESSKLNVLYDPRFLIFFVVYEFHFEVEESRLIKLLNVSPENTQKNDLFNILRSLIVKEDASSVLSDWANQSRENILGKLKKLVEGTFKTTSEKSIYIGKNTGNITFYFEVDCQNEILKKAVLNCNAGAEAIRRDIEPVINNSEVCFSFFGRFHTVISKNNDYYYKYFPIQFHMQFVWFLTGFYIERLDAFNNEIIHRKKSEFFNKRIDEVDSYVNKIQFLIMHNENFKLTIEKDNELVLQKIQGNWNIENSLANANQYIAVFKAYLDRQYLKRQAASEARQNKILFVISCVQIIALISVWADYLVITNPEEKMLGGVLQRIFGNVDNLANFNVWLPIGLGFVILTITLSALFKKR